MESTDGEARQQNHQLEKRRLNRAPSPARPFLKDVHCRASKAPAITPKSPKLPYKQQTPSAGLPHAQNRLSRRNVSGAKEKPAPAKSLSKSTVTKKAAKTAQRGPAEPKTTNKQAEPGPLFAKSKKGKIALAHGSFGLGSPVRVPTGSALGRVSHTDSSSDLSDCLSEPLSDEQKQAQAASSDAESGSGSSDREQLRVASPFEMSESGHAPLLVKELYAAKERPCRGLFAEGQTGSDELAERCKAGFRTGGIGDAPGERKAQNDQELLREIEDLRSENDYLKDELEELRAEMEEVRDSYMEEEAYQLQELRRELDRANKNCRILQYRLRKSEQKSLRVAQTGQVDGELLRSLEQDLKVAKDVSVRLHNELESVEDKRSRAEDENELLRQKLIEVEISKQALHNELERAKESSQKRRGGRESFKERKSSSQEDSADLRCQLQFAKEESTLMRKKMAKLGREKEELEQELQKYKSLYGDVESPLLVGESGGGPHSTREAELKLRLKLVEEEANILGRKIVELEVENRGLRAENEDIRSQYERDFPGREPLSSLPTSPFGDGLESGSELRRHLQFVEEEAELLRRSIAEIEDRNKQLTSELNRFKLGPGPDSEGAPRAPAHDVGTGHLQDELKAARLQIDELSGKVLKLQYENRVLLSTVQRCDLASQRGPPRGPDDDEEPAQLPGPQPKREGPVGGESDSDDPFERTSGIGSGKPSDTAGGGAGVGPEALVGVWRQAERLGRMVERLAGDTDSAMLLMGAEVQQGESDSKLSRPALDAICSRMRTFRAELHVFMEKVEHLREQPDDLSPMAHLTESSSFLSGVTSMSRDSPLGTLGRDLITDFQQRDTPVLEVSEVPEQPELEQRLQPDPGCCSSTAQKEEEEKECRKAEPWLSTQEQAWAQERALLQQELRLLRHNMAAVYVKLRWLLVNWRLGRRSESAVEDAPSEPETLDSVPELSRLMEQVEGVMDREDQPSLQPGTEGTPEPGLSPQATELLQHQKQAGENRRVLHALRMLLEEFRSELRDEEQRRSQLQQAYANEKASWEVQWAELRCQIPQRDECSAEVTTTGDTDPRVALSREREEHRRLLAESHSTSLDLLWRLQHSEKRWSRERAELLECFDRDRQDWDWHMRDVHRKQRELNLRRADVPSSEAKDGSPRVFSPQGSPRTPRSPRSPRVTGPAPSAARPNPESDAPLESLFLDTLSLDPLGETEVPLASRLDGEKRFPCINKNLNEISERKGLAVYHEEETGGGNLLRAKSVCSMSEFQRLMDSSPFLPDRSTRGDAGTDDVTPPLSPDDLKYIEEYNSKGWDSPSHGGATSGTPAPEHMPDTFQPSSWFLTTSATLTTSTLSGPEHCQRQPPWGAPGPERYGVRVLHSPPLSCKLDGSVAPPVGERPCPGPEDVYGRWQHRDLLEGGLRPPERSVCSTVGFASSLELELSRNLSDDMKEVAFSVRNAMLSSPVERHLKDTACQTNGFTTRGTQTTQTISVGLQTEALRNLTSSPLRCLTPKGGSTPISSPSRSLRKVQYSPAVQGKFERPCCSPKYGSPKLQRKPLSCKAEQPASRVATPSTPQKGCSESAWARSTTTRDSPVHTTINDGLSSLFSIIDHTPAVNDTTPKFTKSPSRSRPADPGSAECRSPSLGVLQDLLKSTRGRSPSPVQLIVEAQGDRTPEVISIRQDLSAPPGYGLAENAARLLNKKLMEQALKEDKRPASGSQMGLSRDGDKGPLGPVELPCSPVAPPLDSHFLRPARPANRRPPSRWAARSPSTSPRRSRTAERRFCFPLSESEEAAEELNGS
ncbi:microtubule cross-linking factor 1 isoform X4 [Brienomyrus brachyistius]|uniref:microtubule cross-linking factor 1 isoform X4 n=1 Tax=Brienomyrus brachyistius TaxID=42636 RepID=UPI0020B17A40|nr:microtubule cross-linking factor 1 isoform X4 [Brienomyrus brachyistius]